MQEGIRGFNRAPDTMQRLPSDAAGLLPSLPALLPSGGQQSASLLPAGTGPRSPPQPATVGG